MEAVAASHDRAPPCISIGGAAQCQSTGTHHWGLGPTRPLGSIATVLPAQRHFLALACAYELRKSGQPVMSANSLQMATVAPVCMVERRDHRQWRCPRLVCRHLLASIIRPAPSRMASAFLISIPDR